MELVAFLGQDIENYGQVAALIKKGEWEKSVIIKNQSSGAFNEGTESISIDSNKPIIQLKEELMNQLRPKIDGSFEVALSLASGNGKEHMALISALLSIPVGIRLVVYTKKGVEFIN